VTKRRWLIVGLVLVLLVGAVIAGRSALRMFGRRPPPPRQTDVTLIASWMTPGYISRVYRVPSDQLFQGLGIPPQGSERKSLNDLAAQTNRSPDELVAAAQATVKDVQARQPPPGQKPVGQGGNRGPPAKATP
jgi:hypothetical protein